MSYQWRAPADPISPPVGFVCSGCGWHSLDEDPPRGCKYCDGNGSNILRISDHMQPTTAADMARMFPQGIYTPVWVDDEGSP